MGTHPIFESDFDCLTEVEMLRAATRSATALCRASEIPAGAMSFSFASPIQEFYTSNQDIIQVDIPTMTGTIGILPQHVPTFGVLAPGVVTIMQKGSAEKYFVSSGSFTVNADSSVNIIAEEAPPRRLRQGCRPDCLELGPNRNPRRRRRSASPPEHRQLPVNRFVNQVEAVNEKHLKFGFTRNSLIYS